MAFESAISINLDLLNMSIAALEKVLAVRFHQRVEMFIFQVTLIWHKTNEGWLFSVESNGSLTHLRSTPAESRLFIAKRLPDFVQRMKYLEETTLRDINTLRQELHKLADDIAKE